MPPTPDPGLGDGVERELGVGPGSLTHWLGDPSPVSVPHLGEYVLLTTRDGGPSTGGVCVVVAPLKSVARVAIRILELSLVGPPHSSWSEGWAQSDPGTGQPSCETQGNPGLQEKKGQGWPRGLRMAGAHVVSAPSWHLRA